MPTRNSVKKYIKDGVYHIYNRGVEKRIIFIDKTDEKVFYKYLKSASKRYKILIIKYKLMPNHFHIIIKQNDYRDIVKFMKSVGIRYTCYFNYKYQRVGRLFQGIYKARTINTEEELEIIKDYLDNQ